MSPRSALLVACAALIAAPAPVSAGIPPAGWKAPEWHGPGLVCAPAFSLQLQEGERVVQGYPSVGEIRYTVHATGGNYEVVEEWIGIRTYPDRKRPQRRSNGTVYLLTSAEYGPGTTYLFMPDNYRLPFRANFGVPAHAPSSAVVDEAKELERIRFATPNRQGCLREQKPADAALAPLHQ